MKTGLVFSGGGAKGAYSAGVATFLKDEIDKVPVVGGTSTGALIACCIGSNNWKLLEYIYNGGVETKDIIRPSVLPDSDVPLIKRAVQEIQELSSDPLVWLGAATLAGDDSIYDIDPLIEIIDNHIDFKKFFKSGAINTYFCGVEFTTVKTRYFDNWRTSQNPDMLRLGLLASVSMPVFMALVRIGNKYYCDGGLTSFIPIDPLTRSPRFTEVEQIIMVDTLDPSISPTSKPTNLLEMLLQSVSKVTDMQCYTQRELAYKQLNGRARGIKVYQISPSRKLATTDSLNFNIAKMKEDFQLGIDDARLFVKEHL